MRADLVPHANHTLTPRRVLAMTQTAQGQGNANVSEQERTPGGALLFVLHSLQSHFNDRRSCVHIPLCTPAALKQTPPTDCCDLVQPRSMRAR